MRTIEYLEKVKEKIEYGWTKGAFARDSNGEVVSTTDAKACSWCFVGAMRTVAFGQYFNEMIPGRTAILNANPHIRTQYLDSLSSFNDTHSKEDIIAVIDNTVTYLKSNNEHA